MCTRIEDSLLKKKRMCKRRMQGVPCSICSESGHHPSHCPELCDPLRPGFSGAGGGGGGGGGDDEDEKAGVRLRLHTEQQAAEPIHNTEDVVVQRIDACCRRTAGRSHRIVHEKL